MCRGVGGALRGFPHSPDSLEPDVTLCSARSPLTQHENRQVEMPV